MTRIEQSDEVNAPAGEVAQTGGGVLRVAVTTPGAPQDTELIGKTIGQTAAEREDAEYSGADNADGAMLPRLWEAWQQPLRLMRRVSRRVSHDMQQAFESVVGRDVGGVAREPAGNAAHAWTPAVETAQREQEFIVCAELPGVKRNEVRVQVKHDRLTIEGDRLPEPLHGPDEQRRSERCYGHFYRVVPLPPGADPDAASASMHDGMLEISIPISASAQRARELDVRGD